MKIHHMPQGSQEWLDIRKGRLTASQMSQILTPTGKLSTQADKLARKLARECRFDDPIAPRPTAAMKWGTDMEPLARAEFIAETGHDVGQVGFVTHDNYYSLGCSPDGLLWPQFATSGSGWIAGLEIKCPAIDTLVDWKLAQRANPAFIPPEHLPQIHGSMIVTGLRTWHFAAFFPGVPIMLGVVHWSDYTDKLQAAVFEFMERYEIIRRDVLSVLGEDGTL
jgi:hypothetical protein